MDDKQPENMFDNTDKKMEIQAWLEHLAHYTYQREKIDAEMIADAEVRSLMEQERILRDNHAMIKTKLDVLSKPYMEEKAAMGRTIAEYEKKIIAGWGAHFGDTKQVLVKRGSATVLIKARTTQTVEVTDRPALLGRLAVVHRLNEGIKDFNKKFIRTLIDAEIIREKDGALLVPTTRLYPEEVVE